METITARWSPKGDSSKDVEIYAFTLGVKDHLLHQGTRQYNRNPPYVTRYFHSRPNAKLPDSLFVLPSDAVNRPISHVVTIEEDTVILDKGSLDGIVVGDEIALLFYAAAPFGNAELK